MTTLFKSAVVILMNTILIGCGSSDDGAQTNDDLGTTATVENTAIGNSGQTTDPSTVAQSAITDMVINPIDDLALNFALEVNVKLANIVDSSYLTICQYDSDTDTVDHNRCLFRGPIDQSGVLTTLNVAHPDTELAAEIWQFQDGYRPNRFIWQYASNRVVQTFIVR